MNGNNKLIRKCCRCNPLSNLPFLRRVFDDFKTISFRVKFYLSVIYPEGLISDIFITSLFINEKINFFSMKVYINLLHKTAVHFCLVTY